MPDRSPAAPPSSGETVPLFEDKDILVVATRHAAPGAVITFSSINEHQRGFGQDFFDRQGLSGVYCIARWNHWYQPAGCRAAVPHILRHLDTLPPGPRMTYGISMGGFAAALFSERLAADAVLMLSPQFSNDPDKAPHETRWLRDAPAISRRARKFVIYDSTGPDARQAELFGRFAGTALLPTPHAGHRTGHFLHQAQILTEVVLRAWSGELDWAWYRAAVRRQRGLSGNYWREIAQAARQRHPALSLAAFERAAALRPGDATILNDYGNALLRANRWDDAAAVFRSGAAAAPTAPAPLRGLAMALVRLDQPAEAVEAAAQAVALRPGSTDLKRVLATALLAAEETVRARQVVAELMEAEPDLPANQRLLARVGREPTPAAAPPAGAPPAEPVVAPGPDRAAGSSGPAAPPPADETVTLFEDEDILVVATRHASPGAVISFSSLNEHEKGFGQDFFSRHGVSGVYCIARWNHWYQPPGCRAAVPHILRHLATLPPGPRMTYGASMGGFAAALFSGRLGADAVLMLAPQFSNDPARPPHEERWQREAQAIRFEDDDLGAAMSRRARKFVVYDSTGPDARHAELFGRFAGTVLLPTPHAGHAMGHFLLQTRLLTDLVLRALDGTLDWAWYRAAVRQQRRIAGNYWRELAQAARRRPVLALECFRQAAVLRPREPAILNDYGNALLRAGAAEAALGVFGDAALVAPTAPAPLRGMALALGQLGRLQEAVEAAERAVGLRPDSSDLRRVLTSALIAAGETERARAAVDALLATEPDLQANRRLAAMVGADTA